MSRSHREDKRLNAFDDFDRVTNFNILALSQSEKRESMAGSIVTGNYDVN